MLSFNATLILVFVSFVIFMLLMKSLFFDPMFAIKDQRARKISEDQKNAETFSAELLRLMGEYDATISDARRQAQQTILSHREEAKASAGKTIGEARENARLDLERQIAELAELREKTYRELDSERSNLVRLILDKVTAGKSPVGSRK